MVKPQPVSWLDNYTDSELLFDSISPLCESIVPKHREPSDDSLRYQMLAIQDLAIRFDKYVYSKAQNHLFLCLQHEQDYRV